MKPLIDVVFVLTPDAKGFPTGEGNGGTSTEYLTCVSLYAIQAHVCPFGF